MYWSFFKNVLYKHKVKNVYGFSGRRPNRSNVKDSNFTRCLKRTIFVYVNRTRRVYPAVLQRIEIGRTFFLKTFSLRITSTFHDALSHGVFPMHKLENVKTIYRVKNP